MKPLFFSVLSWLVWCRQFKNIKKSILILDSHCPSLGNVFRGMGHGRMEWSSWDSFFLPGLHFQCPVLGVSQVAVKFNVIAKHLLTRWKWFSISSSQNIFKNRNFHPTELLWHYDYLPDFESSLTLKCKSHSQTRYVLNIINYLDKITLPLDTRLTMK